MGKYISPVLLVLIVLPCLIESKKYNHILENGGQLWALLVAGSEGYGNYRHQADICHAYQILHANGIPDSNIIVMMVDDIANNTENPTKGIIINKPNGTNVYEGVPKDYTGDNVNIRNFLHVLSGDENAMKGIGSGRVIKSGPNDHIFVNFVDHGGSGVLCFPTEELPAADLINTLEKIAANKQFGKMVLYVEACYSGSMFDDILPDDLEIFATTAADPHESSYAIYFDHDRGTYLGDVFSVNWMEDSEHEDLDAESLNHQFQRVRTMTNTSHIEEYGDLDIGNTKLSEVIGESSLNQNITKQNKTIFDAVPNHHVPVAILTKKLGNAKTQEERQKFHMELEKLFKARSDVDRFFLGLLQASVPDIKLLKKVLYSKDKLTRETMHCHKNLINNFSSKCMSIAKNPYIITHTQKFINLCNLSRFNESMVISSMNEFCRANQQVLLKGVV